MFRSRWLVLVVLVLSMLANAGSTKTVPVPRQLFSFCPQHFTDLICFVPSFGLQNFPTFSFQAAEDLRLNNLFGIETSGLPFQSPSAGVTFVFDPKLGVVTRSLESFGPILSDRAETLGRHRLAMGFSYEHFNFDTLESAHLSNLAAAGGSGLVNSLTLRLDEFTTFLTFGLTSRIDVSAAIPVRTVRMTGTGFLVTSLANNPSTGATVITGVAPNSQHAGSSGLSDIMLRAKGQVLKWEHGGVSLGLDVRTPTGEPFKFLGSGAFGAKPFVIASWGRQFGRIYIGPHVNTGFEWNGRSILGGELLGVEGRLPRRWVYAVGTEVGAFKRTTITLDLTGERLFNGEHTYLFNTPSPGLVTIGTKSVNLKDGSIGAKVNPWRNLLLTGNLSWRLDRGGLRARMVPLGGISYTF